MVSRCGQRHLSPAASVLDHLFAAPDEAPSCAIGAKASRHGDSLSARWVWGWRCETSVKFPGRGQIPHGLRGRPPPGRKLDVAGKPWSGLREF